MIHILLTQVGVNRPLSRWIRACLINTEGANCQFQCGIISVFWDNINVDIVTSQWSKTITGSNCLFNETLIMPYFCINNSKRASTMSCTERILTFWSELKMFLKWERHFLSSKCSLCDWIKLSLFLKFGKTKIVLKTRTKCYTFITWFLNQI